MFEFKTRSETVDGCRFTEQDMLLFDYVYSGNIILECVADFKVPGFGFVIVEEDEESPANKSLYIVKFGKRNQYQIIYKDYQTQTEVINEYIAPGADIIPGEADNLRLNLKITDNELITVNYLTLNEDGTKTEISVIEYRLSHELSEYKLGIYSSGGNVLRFASISSQAPSNWVSNVFNGNGGRINWITNGFEIENCEFDCEVESQLLEIPVGKYYFDFKTTNPEIKYYIYPSSLKDTDEKRLIDEILATKDDEKKNILDKTDNSFELAKDGFINIKFKGKWGRITNIAVKKFKTDDFVETDYDTITRESSYIRFNLDVISKIEMEGYINAVPELSVNGRRDYSVFLCDSVSLGVEDLHIELNKFYRYSFTKDTGILKIGNVEYSELKEAATKDKYLTVFKNLDGIITKLIITDMNGEQTDVILQKTFKVTVNKDIKTPILVTDLKYAPYNLNSAYREVITNKKVLEFFHKFNPINLKHHLLLKNNNLRLAGSNRIKISANVDTIEDAAENFELISPNYYTVDYANNGITIQEDIKEKYKYILVEFISGDDISYEFTNWEREYYDLNLHESIYLTYEPLEKSSGNVIIYAVPKRSGHFYPDNIYLVPDEKAINSIDYCADVYDILTEKDYKITSSGQIVINEETRNLYAYLVIDYLKSKNYAINERENYYEVDIATPDEVCKVIYDSTENDVINIYKKLNLDKMVANNFIVLRKE